MPQMSLTQNLVEGPESELFRAISDSVRWSEAEVMKHSKIRNDRFFVASDKSVTLDELIEKCFDKSMGCSKTRKLPRNP